MSKIVMLLALAAIFSIGTAWAETHEDALAINRSLCSEIKPAIDRHLAIVDKTLIADGLGESWAQQKVPLKNAEPLISGACATYLGVLAEALEDAALMHAMAAAGAGKP